MKLFTERQYQKLIENGKPENRDKDHAPVVRIYTPFAGCQWLISELDPQCPNIAFGLCDLGMDCPELGYINLEELTSVKTLAFKVIGDGQFRGVYPMSVYSAAARICDRITQKEALLKKCYAIYLSLRKA